jgi:nifR3 family TIM-barrel protein
MKIGNVRIKNDLVMAPMFNVTNLPFRLMCRKYGAGLVYSEMINVNALGRGNKATERMCKTVKGDKPIAFQLFGLREEAIKKSVKFVEDKADIIDFNFGCPATHVVGVGSGAALLKRPEKMGSIIRTLIKTTDKPVTVKIRLGFNNNKVKKLAKVVEDAGASAIAIHCRTFRQGYSGRADWKALEKVDVGIPVIGNGDVKDKKSYEKLRKVCDAVMIGRAAMNNPALFSEILGGQPVSHKQLFSEYYELCKKYDMVDLHNLRMRACDFTRGLKDSSKLREKLSKIEDVNKLLEAMR